MVGDMVGHVTRLVCGSVVPIFEQCCSACGGVMKAVRWEDTKRRIRVLRPVWDCVQRVASRERSRDELRRQRGCELAALRHRRTRGV